jgi:putative hemolysin
MTDGGDPTRAGRRSRSGRRRFVPPYRPMRATLSPAGDDRPARNDRAVPTGVVVQSGGAANTGGTADDGSMTDAAPSADTTVRDGTSPAVRFGVSGHFERAPAESAPLNRMTLDPTAPRPAALGRAASDAAASDVAASDVAASDVAASDLAASDRSAVGPAGSTGAATAVGVIAVARSRRPVVPAPRRGTRRGVVVRQPGRISRLLGRLAVRAADAASRFGARRLGVRAPETAGRFATNPTDGVGPGPRISESELRELVAANVVIDGGQRQIIAEVLAAGVRHVREVMVPRTDAIFVAAGDPVAVALDRVLASRHSRFPVIDGTHDDVIGVIQVWDLLLADATDGLTVGGLARPVHHIPGSKRVLAALSDMRREGHHLAVVVDEYGGTAGIVTLEDLVEELVGEVHADGIETEADETGTDAFPAMDGRTNLNDFAERCGFVLPPGPYETVGGFVMARLGRLPHPGDEVTVGAWRLVVTECEGRRVSRVSVRPMAS